MNKAEIKATRIWWEMRIANDPDWIGYIVEEKIKCCKSKLFYISIGDPRLLETEPNHLRSGQTI